MSAGTSYIYHYHATIQASPGEITNIDGLLTCKKKIDSMDRYAEIKMAVADVDEFDVKKLVICSLSLLHESLTQDLGDQP